MTRVAEGWNTEPGDVTVGMHGDIFYHEDCPGWADDMGLVGVELVENLIVSTSNGIVTVEEIWECPLCQTRITLQVQEPAHWYEEGE